MAAAPRPNRELATVLFVDIVDSTRRLAAVGDRAWSAFLDAFDAINHREARQRGGDMVKSTGDGSVLVLPSPSAALDAAEALHVAAGQLGVEIRIGAHTGELERRGQDIAGIAVHVAARLMSEAQAGETLVSETVRLLAADGGTRTFEPRGAHRLKGFDSPVTIYAVAPATEPSTAEPQPELGASNGTAESVVRLLQTGRLDEAAGIVERYADVPEVLDAALAAAGRAEFLDVDLTFVRLLEDLYDRLDAQDLVRRAMFAAKIAFELRGDAATVTRRRALLDEASELAERAGDPVALSAVLVSRVNALWESHTAADRLAAADRVISLTRRTRDLDRELEARVARIHALAELGRVRDAELELGTYARLVEPSGRAYLKAFLSSRRGLIATVYGRLDDILRYGEEAYEYAVAAGMPDAERLRMAFRTVAARFRAGPEMDQVLEAAASMFRQSSIHMPGQYFEADVAMLDLYLGRPDAARAELARALPSLLNYREYRWSFVACNAADTAAEVGTADMCERLYAALLPHQDEFVVLGPIFWGAVASRLGVLAARLGRLDAALVHLRRAVTSLDEMGALLWAAPARLALADVLDARGDQAAAAERASALETARALGLTRLLTRVAQQPPSTADAWSLRRDGEDWVLEAGSERARARGSRGFEHLHVLLSNPGRDIAAIELDAGGAAVPEQGGIEILDDSARAAYRKRIADIDSALESADRAGDAQHAAALEDERNALITELRRATGLGGRSRRTNDASERARVNVTRSIKRALEQIVRVAPTAGAHLTASVRTGTSCRYDPAPGGPARWLV